MSHDELRARMMDLDDPELSERSRGELESHLAGCASCRAAVASWRAAKTAFFAAPQKPARRQTELFVRAVMERAAAPAFDWKALIAPAFGLAFAAAAVLAAIPTTPSDPAEALIERDTGLYAFASRSAPRGADDVLAFATEDR